MLEIPRIKYKISSLYGQVNAEIKRLLVASVGEDIGSRYFKISVLQIKDKLGSLKVDGKILKRMQSSSK